MNNHQGKASTPINLRALELIRGAFKGSQMTQEELANAAGIPRSTLANMLSETAVPRLVSVEWFTRIALALGADAGDWFDDLERVGKGALSPSVSTLHLVPTQTEGLQGVTGNPVEPLAAAIAADDTAGRDEEAEADDTP